MNDKLKILLINPEIPNTFWSLKNALKFVSRKALLPPLGLLTVAAMLPESFEKKLVDMNVSALHDFDIKWADYVFISANAPPGTKLYQKLKNENRLAEQATGDNMDCTMNFIPKMNTNELMDGYMKVLNTIYSQKYICKRIKTFLKNYNYSNKKKFKVGYRDIKAFFRAMWRIGVIEKGNIHYWALLIWSFKDFRRVPLAVRYSIFGFHFRKTLKSIHAQMKELAANSANECGIALAPKK